MRLMDPSQPTTNPLPERNTIRAALAGDQAAFQELVYLYGRRIYAVAYGVVQDAAEAEDIVQETFLKAYSRRDSLRDPDRFPAWLCQTARNHALDTLRKRRPIPFPNQQAGLEQIADDAVPSPSAGLSLADRDHAVRTLLLTLPENHRIAITLRFMDGMDYREIERTMGIAHGTVRGILARAMKTLRKSAGAALLAELTGASQ
jgi:RNA polymerase sigma-70 factor (ECF subfamily)